MSKKRALITGVTGQDGSYLAEYLLTLGYEVHGTVRRVAVENPEARFSRITHILEKLTIHSVNLELFESILNVFMKHKYDECYHLGAQSFVSESFVDAFSTMNVNINSTHYLLEIISQLNPTCKFYFAGSSEMYGKVHETPQSETTEFHPRSPYAISKVTCYDLTRLYREKYNLFCVTGIMFNHESPRRGHEFVTRKITRGIAQIKSGIQKELRMGNLEAQRDWGHAKDYVRAMYLMLQMETPEDYVISMGETHSVREFCEKAFNYAGLNYLDYVVEDPAFYRPAEVDLLKGDSSKARMKLNWYPEYSFEELIFEMVNADINLVST